MFPTQEDTLLFLGMLVMPPSPFRTLYKVQKLVLATVFFLTVLPVLYLSILTLAYFTVRLSQLIMAERRSLYIIACFLALHGSAKGFELEGHDGNKIIQLVRQEQCVTILATDLETYNGMFSKMFNFYFHDYISLHGFLPDIGLPMLRFKNIEELSKVREHHLFSSVLASSSCIITIIETHDDDETLDAIDMMNGVRADRKQLLLLVPTFDITKFKNITINYDVAIEHSDGGDSNIKI